MMNHLTAPIARRDLFKAAELNKHEQTHVSEEPFRCSLCEKRFAKGVELSQREQPYAHAIVNSHIFSVLLKEFIFLFRK